MNQKIITHGAVAVVGQGNNNITEYGKTNDIKEEEQKILHQKFIDLNKILEAPLDDWDYDSYQTYCNIIDRMIKIYNILIC